MKKIDTAETLKRIFQIMELPTNPSTEYKKLFQPNWFYPSHKRPDIFVYNSLFPK